MPETQLKERTGSGPVQQSRGIELRAPCVADGAAIHRLIEGSPPLDVNSRYAYLLLCRDFAATCVHATRAGRTVGFVSAYRPPRAPDVIFVWQVAVAGSARGGGLGRSMLLELLERDSVAGCRHLETTITPSNEPSRRMFLSLARELGAPVEERPLFGPAEFSDARHEEEVLIRIGPMKTPITRGERRNES